MKFKRSISFIFILTILTGLCATAQNTVVSGKVYDGETGEAMPYTNVTTNARTKTTVGTTSDPEGKFKIVSSIKFDTLIVRFMGYKEARVPVIPHRTQVVNVEMKTSSTMLKEAVVVGKRTRYTRRGNPAVEFMENVIKYKDSNSVLRQPFYCYNTHEKAVLGLLNVSDSLRYKPLFRKAGFMFDNIQKSPLSDNTYLPVYFMEHLVENHYRRDPVCLKRLMNGEKGMVFTRFLDPQSITLVLHNVLGNDLDFNKNYVHILGTDIMSPIASFATLFYRYYITDSISYNGDSCLQISFTPSNLHDIGFSGTIIADKHKPYAVRELHIEMPQQSNVNWVEKMAVNQQFTRVNDTQLCITRNSSVMEGNVYGVEMFGQRNLIYGDYTFEGHKEPSFYNLHDVTQFTTGYNRHGERWWDSNRVEPLLPYEKRLYELPQKLKTVSAYNLGMNVLMSFFGDYLDMGKFDIGPMENTVSWNDVEGVRLRVGGKTNTQFNRRWFAYGFLAYGTKDKKAKYQLELMRSFADKLYHQWEFPVNLLTVGVEHNNEIPGQKFRMGTYDRFTLSFSRGSNDMMVQNHRYYVEWWYETPSQLSTKVRLEHKAVVPQGALKGSFRSIGTDAAGAPLASYDARHPMYVPTANVMLRYAKDERFISVGRFRRTTTSPRPIVQLDYTYGAPIMGSNNNFHRVNLSCKQRLYVWNLGFADIEMQGGEVFGKADYPQLFVHQANQNWAYQEEAFNLMNYFEFISDRYFQAMLNYNLNGYILNRIPLLNKLGWREVFAIKGVWGSIRDSHMPGPDNGLIAFATNAKGTPLSYPLSEGPYVEGNIGIDNIFDVLRIDFVRRFTYLDHPGIATWGIRFRLHVGF